MCLLRPSNWLYIVFSKSSSLSIGFSSAFAFGYMFYQGFWRERGTRQNSCLQISVKESISLRPDACTEHFWMSFNMKIQTGVTLDCLGAVVSIRLKEEELKSETKFGLLLISLLYWISRENVWSFSVEFYNTVWLLSVFLFGLTLSDRYDIAF